MSAPHPWEIQPKDLVDLLASDAPPLVLDCREASELELARLADVLHVPMGDVPARIPELENHLDATVVVHCHHGVRSLQVVAFMKEAGFEDVRSLAGGIDRWSLEIDPSIPRY